MLPGAIIEKAIAPMVESIEKEYGIDAWFKNIGLITIPISDEEKYRIRTIMRSAGYRAYISNEEMQCGPHYIEYCEINLIRFDIGKFVSEG